ncbi:MAG TPA: hypothetical protein VKQ28_10965 [Candidatus Acidoferrum sp.]|nr:hypothetical protein [Candidatus Acidoferrum sp.]
MSHNSVSPASTPERCQYRTATGRQCCIPAVDSISSFCARHAASEPSDSEDLAPALTARAFSFQRAQGVNNSLGTLYHLLAGGRISPRRASVLAYISNLLLRTLPAIDYDKKHGYYDDAEDTYDDDAEGDGCNSADAQAEGHVAHRQQEAAPSAATSLPPGKEPLPKTAEEFAAAVLAHNRN